MEAITNIYGSERDKYIARAKIVLNMHLYETQIFEAVRVSYLLANSKAVVSECNEQTEIDEGFKNSVVFAPYKKLADACVELIEDPTKRRQLEKKGFSIMSARNESAYLHAALKKI